MKKIVFLVLLAVCLLLVSCDALNLYLPNEHEHHFGEWSVEREATCTEEGAKVRTCDCGETEAESIAATGHSPSDWIIDTAATCKEAGLRHTECTVCKTVLEIFVPVYQSRPPSCSTLSRHPRLRPGI